MPLSRRMKARVVSRACHNCSTSGHFDRHRRAPGGGGAAALPGSDKGKERDTCMKGQGKGHSNVPCPSVDVQSLEGAERELDELKKKGKDADLDAPFDGDATVCSILPLRSFEPAL